MSRCYACCQENCGYGHCSCDCHGGRQLTTTAQKCPCKQHARYQAKRRPRTACEACWRFYVGRNL